MHKKRDTLICNFSSRILQMLNGDRDKKYYLTSHIIGAPFLTLQNEQSKFHRQFGISFVSICSFNLSSTNRACKMRNKPIIASITKALTCLQITSGIQKTQEICAHWFGLVVGLSAPPTFVQRTQTAFFLEPRVNEQINRFIKKT